MQLPVLCHPVILYDLKSTSGLAYAPGEFQKAHTSEKTCVLTTPLAKLNDMRSNRSLFILLETQAKSIKKPEGHVITKWSGTKNRFGQILEEISTKLALLYSLYFVSLQIFLLSTLIIIRTFTCFTIYCFEPTPAACFTKRKKNIRTMSFHTRVQKSVHFSKNEISGKLPIK